MSTSVSAVVEGDLDAAVVRRLAADAGLMIATIHVRGGKQNIRRRIDGYDMAARYSPFVVLVDLDREYGCAPDLVVDWLPNRQPHMCFRVAVRAVIVPRARSGRQVGVAYSSRLGEFVANSWSPEVAAVNCESLARARVALTRLAAVLE